jgi:hypothetical protein
MDEISRQPRLQASFPDLVATDDGGVARAHFEPTQKSIRILSYNQRHEQDEE